MELCYYWFVTVKKYYRWLRKRGGRGREEERKEMGGRCPTSRIGVKEEDEKKKEKEGNAHPG
jgi:hypothetical protein